MPKYGAHWSYYLDNNIYNYLVQEAPGPTALEVLKHAKDAGKAKTYLSAYNVSELAATYQSNPSLAIELLKAARAVAVPGGMKDTPEILKAEVQHLLTPATRLEILEAPGSPADRYYVRTLDDLINRPLYNARLYIDLYEDVTRRKESWRESWREARRVLGEMIGNDSLPFAPHIDAFFDWSWETGYIAVVASSLRPPDMRTMVTGAEITRRLDDTIGFRSMVYFTMSALGYQCFLREDRPHFGDAIDHHHGIYAGYFDIFVSNDGNCRKYATKGLRGAERVMSLDEFLAFLGTL